MHILILGGTGDAKRALAALQQLPPVQELQLTYAIAGLVRPANVDCEVVSGGFSQFGGLASYLRDKTIGLVIDCTHPYAAQISGKAVTACVEISLPCWRLQRRPWQAEPGDQWQSFNNWEELLPNLRPFSSVMITSGQLNKASLADWGNMPRQQKQLLRTAVAPEHKLPASMTWHQAIGPFRLDDELALMKTYNVDVLVSKNSGGNATVAKLVAVRQLGIPVMMFDRPDLPACDRSFATVTELVTAVEQMLNKEKNSE